MGNTDQAEAVVPITALRAIRMRRTGKLSQENLLPACDCRALLGTVFAHIRFSWTHAQTVFPATLDCTARSDGSRA